MLARIERLIQPLSALHGPGVGPIAEVCEQVPADWDSIVSGFVDTSPEQAACCMSAR